MDGFINFLKPPGMTSSDAVLYLRRMLPKGTKTGHCGTLDPDASGVLPLAVGKATRLFDYLVDKEKTYLTEVRLGISTDTQDATGRLISRRPVVVNAAQVEEKLSEFVGWIEQTPPMYSAVQIGGRRLYALAREGVAIERPKRNVWVKSAELVSQSGLDRYTIRVTCGKGVYIRTLMNDLGEALGCGGVMTFLLREKAGLFDLQHTCTPEELAASGPQPRLYPMDAPLDLLPRTDVPKEMTRQARNGNAFHIDMTGPAMVRIYLDDCFAGVGAVDDTGTVRFRAMLL